MSAAATTVDRQNRRDGIMPSTPPVGALAARAPRRPHHRAAAAGQAAAAGEDGVDVPWIAGFALDLIVVGELLAGGDGTDRVDEHARFLDHRLAVRVAGMIHEAGLVT